MLISNIIDITFNNVSWLVLLSSLLFLIWLTWDFVCGLFVYQTNSVMWNISNNSYKAPNFAKLEDFNPYHFLIFNIISRLKNIAIIIFSFSVFTAIVVFSIFNVLFVPATFQSFFGNNAFQINLINLNFFWLFGLTFSFLLYKNIPMWIFRQQGPVLIKQFVFLPSLLGLLYVSLVWLLFANDLLLISLLLVSFSLLSYTIFMILPSRLVIEATIKYYALSAVSLILFMFGLVLLFSLTGTCNLFLIKNVFLINVENFILINNVVLKLSFLGILSGLLFKLGAAPFHLWVADVYESIEIDFTALFAIPVKIAVFGCLYNLTVMHFYPIFSTWHIWFWSVAILSVIVGCFGALRQKKILRFYAYTAINQMGFLLFSILVTVRLFNDVTSIFVFENWLSLFSLNVINVTWYYLVIYMLLSLLFFYIYSYSVRNVIVNINGINSNPHLLNITSLFHFTKLKYIYSVVSGEKTFSGLIVGSLIILFFSMSGLPPFPLFYGKFQLFYEMLLCNSFSTVFLMLLISVISTFYYLRVINSLLFQNNKFYESILVNINSYKIK